MIFYRSIMRLAHRSNWHYAPPIYPEGDTHLWCEWCGFRQTVKRKGDRAAELNCNIRADGECVGKDCLCDGPEVGK